MLAVWSAYLLFAVAREYLAIGSMGPSFWMQHGAITIFSLILNWFLYRTLFLFGEREIRRPLVYLMSIAALFAIVITFLDRQFVVNDSAVTGADWAGFVDGVLIRYLFLTGWGCFYLAIAHHRSLCAAIERSQRLERLSRESELKTLRYQLNPHFIFNALNSVSSLIIDRENERAEQMVDELADYMRAVLSDDGAPMITVAKEIEQQIRYLEIEQVRFPDRLSYQVDIQPEVADWKIPALICQPLIENAVKHGVARSMAPVRISIAAERDGGRLKLSVVNDGRMRVNRDPGTKNSGRGLAIVRDRLAATYGHGAALITANREDGMVVAALIMPDEAHIFRER